jgi:hypothetical protein
LPYPTLLIVQIRKGRGGGGARRGWLVGLFYDDPNLLVWSGLVWSGHSAASWDREIGEIGNKHETSSDLKKQKVIIAVELALDMGSKEVSGETNMMLRTSIEIHHMYLL